MSSGTTQVSKSFRPTRTVLVLGFVSFFADISSEMLYPITPIFLTTALGASIANLGLIEGFAECLASLIKVYFGAASDKAGSRKYFVFTGYFLSAISKPLIGASSSWQHVFFARAADRFGKGIRTAPRDALISESTAKENLGAAFGWHRGMDTFGASIGAFLAIGFLTWFTDLRQVYLWAVVPGLLSAALVLLVREGKSVAAKANTPSVLSRIINLKLSRKLKWYLSAWFIFSIGNSSDIFLILKANQIMSDHRLVILQYVLFTLSFALLAPKLGKLSDHFSKLRVLILGFVVFALVYGGFAFAERPWQLWLLFAIYGIYLAATDGVGKALLAELSPTDSKGAIMGLHGTITGLASFVASLAAGNLWDAYGAKYCFLLGVGSTVIAAIMLAITSKLGALKS